MKRSCLTSDLSAVPYNYRDTQNAQLECEYHAGDITEEEYYSRRWDDKDLGPYGASRHRRQNRSNG